MHLCEQIYAVCAACEFRQTPARFRPMPPQPSSPSDFVRETVVYINLWPESGMKHYSESLVAALVPAVDVLYVRNYESRVSAESWRVELKAVELGGWSTLWGLAREIVRRKPLAIHLNSELPVLLPLFPLFACFNSVITLHDAVPHEGERLAKRLFMQFHLLLLFFFIRKIVVHSESIRAELPFPLRRPGGWGGGGGGRAGRRRRVKGSFMAGRVRREGGAGESPLARCSSSSSSS